MLWLKCGETLRVRLPRANVAVVAGLLLTLVGTVAHAQTFTVLHAFKGRPDGGGAYGGVVVDRAGNIYGTTFGGGRYGAGTVYKITASGEEKIVHHFFHTEGASPFDSLLLDRQGNLFGTTNQAGYGGGTVFELFPGGKLKVLHRFNANVGDGWDPWAGVVQDRAGNVYGTVPFGGGHGLGMVYKVDPNGVETILYSFSGSPDGSGPTGGLAIDPEGNVYGTTQIGGLMGYGTIFKVDPSGNETVLHNFSRTDGEDPLGSVILDGQGNLYGTTSAGGAHFSGTLFKLDASGNLTTLHDFAEFPGDGSVPFSGVVAESSGNLFGTTSTGTGPYFGGTVYKVDINGRVTILHSFTGGTDGGFPNADVVRDAAGNLYGTTVYGGDPVCRCGVVFKITP